MTGLFDELTVEFIESPSPAIEDLSLYPETKEHHKFLGNRNKEKQMTGLFDRPNGGFVKDPAGVVKHTRPTDPDTSRQAGAKAVKRRSHIQQMILRVMRDGVSAIDEEIVASVQAVAGKIPASSVRGARKRLSDAGELVENGTMKTAAGGDAVAWIRGTKEWRDK